MGGQMRAKEIAAIRLASLLAFAILVLLTWGILTNVSNCTSIPSAFGIG
jgi:hypothetical protein